MRNGWRYLCCTLLFGIFVVFNKHSVVAADASSNVNITVQADVDIAFQADGSNTVSDCVVINHTLVPINVRGVRVAECNGWELVPEDIYIYADTKQITLSMEGQNLLGGKNSLDYTIPEQSERELDMDIERGAWTHSAESEKALCLEMEYELGTKEFQLFFDENGSSQFMEPIRVCNGEILSLPVPEREGYDFAGWKDTHGQMHMDEFVMPIGDTTLVAVWKERKAYAIYSTEDDSLTFIKTSQEPCIGETRNGKSIDRVYLDFEESEYTDYQQPPWYRDGIYDNVKRVMVEDEISPICTAYWFYYFESCMEFDLTKINTARVEDMRYMFYRAGRIGEGDFVIRGMEDWNVKNVTSMVSMFSYAGIQAADFEIGDLSQWKTGAVTNMAYMFRSAGEETEDFNIGNIGNWDVSKVTNMSYMFWQAGEYASNFYIGDIGGWDVGNVISMSHMFAYAGYKSSVFEIGNLATWNVGNVTDFTATFWCTGRNATWQLDCSKWDVGRAVYYEYFNKEVEKKVTSPKWVN